MAPVRARLAELAPGVALLENLRFDPGEEANDPAFVDRLVDGFDAYVNDAFGASHRAHASIVGPPTPAALGRRPPPGPRGGDPRGPPRATRTAPSWPSWAEPRWARSSGCCGPCWTGWTGWSWAGGMAFTFLAAQGHSVGASLLDAGRIDSCAKLLDEAGDRIVLPTDFVALEPGGTLGEGAGGSGEVRMVGVDIPRGWRGLDIGPESAGAFADVVAAAGTVFWNGPMGVFEDERFAAGTRTVARAVAESKGFTIVGGGDSVSALEHLGLAGRVGFVSTGGGASLELLEHGDLPGLAALRHASNAPTTGA